MKKIIPHILFIILCSCSNKNEPHDPFVLEKFTSQALIKTNPMKVYVHYMPWFFSKDYDGQWGSHWTMSNANPDDTVAGKASIASHFYPEIGPYSSNDPDVLEYHFLLMKYSGIDGVLIDWYGTQQIYDYPQLLEASNNARNHFSEIGLDYAVVYEDRTLQSIASNDSSLQRQLAAADIQYLKTEYFNDFNYIDINSSPLLPVFGPIVIESPSVWTRIFDDVSINPTFLTLWGEGGDAGIETNGEFAWIWNGGSNHFQLVSSFYNNSSISLKLGIAYPGFKDFYQEGGWGNGLGWEIDPDNGATLESLLDLAFQKNLSHLQIATWNDFGEGTAIEPALEYGTSYLESIQSFTGVNVGKTELALIKDLYDKRKRFKNEPLLQLKLDQVYYYLISLQVAEAQDLLVEIN